MDSIINNLRLQLKKRHSNREQPIIPPLLEKREREWTTSNTITITPISGDPKKPCLY